MNGHVYALGSYNSELIVAGGFTFAGGVPAISIARWNGSAWQPLGGGVGSGSGLIYSLAVYDNQLIAGGAFGQIGGINAGEIARWNGTAWHPLGIGMTESVYALTVNANRVIAGGSFTTVENQVCFRWAMWHSIDLVGDATCDGQVNIDDLLAVVNAWGRCPPPPALCPADINHDGVVNIDELLAVINHWT